MKTQADTLDYKFGLDTEEAITAPNSAPANLAELMTPPPSPTLTPLATSVAGPELPSVEEKVEEVSKFRKALSTKIPRVNIPEPFVPKPVTISSGTVVKAPDPIRITNSQVLPPVLRRTERLDVIPAPATKPALKPSTDNTSSAEADDQIAIKAISTSLKLGGRALIVTLVIACILIGVQKASEYKPEAMMKVANCAASVGAWPMAISIFNDNFNDKKHVNVLIEWANNSRSRKHFETAMVYLNKAINLEPKSALAYNNRGCTQVALGKNQAAIADFTEAIALEPDSVRFWMNRANCYAQMKNYKLALQNYDFAIAHGNKSAVEQKAQVLKLMRAAPHTKNIVHVTHSKNAR
jgi:Tfp pilus assembly protein PilF